MNDAHLDQLLESLRTTFDESFSRPSPVPSARGETVLGVSTGCDCYAIGLTDLAAFQRAGTVAPTPSPMPELLGMVGLRGRVVAVYDPGVLLGGARIRAPRWMAVAARTPIALAFERFDGQWEVPSASFREASGGQARSGSERTLTCGGAARRVLDVAWLVAEISDRCASGARQEGS